MAKTEYDLLDVLERLGMADADRKQQRSIESRLYTLRKGLTSKRKRRDGTYYENPVTVDPQLIEGQDWFTKQGKAIRYTPAGMKKIVTIIGAKSSDQGEI